MKKPAIPSGAGVRDAPTARVLAALKTNIDIITGAVGGEVPALPSDATLADVISTLNAIIRRINRSGT